jgi:hypothetical protein
VDHELSTMQNERAIVTRRDLLFLIGAVSGSAAMYHAMTTGVGFASGSRYNGPIKLDGDPAGLHRGEAFDRMPDQLACDRPGIAAARTDFGEIVQ